MRRTYKHLLLEYFLRQMKDNSVFAINLVPLVSPAHYGKSALIFSYFAIYFTIIFYHTVPILSFDNYYRHMKVWDEKHCVINIIIFTTLIINIIFTTLKKKSHRRWNVCKTNFEIKVNFLKIASAKSITT